MPTTTFLVILLLMAVKLFGSLVIHSVFTDRHTIRTIVALLALAGWIQFLVGMGIILLANLAVLGESLYMCSTAVLMLKIHHTRMRRVAVRLAVITIVGTVTI